MQSAKDDAVEDEDEHHWSVMRALIRLVALLTACLCRYYQSLQQLKYCHVCKHMCGALSRAVACEGMSKYIH
jgi:hypothetical protein